MNELLKFLIAAWGVTETTKLIEQINMPNEYFGNKFFKDREGKYADNIVIPIMRGESIILEAIASAAQRGQSKGATLHKLNAELARFADSKIFTVKDIKHLRSFAEDELKQEEFAKKLAFEMKFMKGKFTTTKEYMRLGAILGEVKDGSGKTLFKFKAPDNPTLDFKGKNPEEIFEQYEDVLIDEFGYAPEHMLLADRELFGKIWAYAEDKNLVQKSIVKKEQVDGVTQIDYNGKTVRPITTKRRDKFGNTTKFLENNKGIFVPIGTDTFKEYYTHAEHTEALEGAPTEYFSKLEELPEGAGAKLIAESICLPVNTRPYATPEVTWS